MAGVRFSSMLFLLLVLIVMSILAKQIVAEPTTTTSTYKSTTIERVTTIQEEVKVVVPKKERIAVAIFVKNRATKITDSKVASLQDYVTGHLTGGSFSVIAREDVANAVASFANAGPNAGDVNLPGQDLDKALSNNTSALQLAGKLGADAVLTVAINSFDATETAYEGHNISVKGTQYKLRASFELLDAYRGGSLTAGVVTVSLSDRQQAGLSVKRDGVVDDLLDAAAADLSNLLINAYRTTSLSQDVTSAKAQVKDAKFTVRVSAANFKIPQVRKDDKGNYTLADSLTLFELADASVEVDGVVMGTTPGPITTTPGLHKLRLKRELFRDWEGTVFVKDGQELSLAMQLNDRGVAQFKDLTTFVQDLKTDQMLTEATVKKIEGYAKMLEASGFKVNATQLPTVQIMNKME